MTKKETLEAALRGEGCLGKAADNEPVFVLRAQDIHAPGVLLYWIRWAKLSGVSTEKREEAERLRQGMLQWQVEHNTKNPD